MLTRLFLFAMLFSCLIMHAQTSVSAKQVQSQWVFLNAGNKLSYKTLEKGDRIMDFSYAGYMGGGVRIPENIPVRISLSPIAGDNTDAIQKAIDEVSKMELVNGFRGAIELKVGTYDCDRTLNITASGIVLRGSGPGVGGSIINMTGKPHNCISVRGNLATEINSDPSF